MDKDNENKLIIDVMSLVERGVQKEKKEIAEKSYMRNIYFQAAQLIWNIVESDTESFAERLVSKGERHNVIAFTGRRGTGKTSAMVSVASMLQEPDFLKKHQIENARFYSLNNHIDASMFTSGDYLLRSVLSEMYSDMKMRQEQNTDFKKETLFQKLRSQFIEILQDYNAVTQMSHNHNNAEIELEAQTDRLYIKNRTESLVKLYLSYMLKSECCENNGKAYLVICIDDIDMAKEIVPDIINAIYLYLMIPNVIVLFTADFRNLKLALQKVFHKSLEFGKESPEIQSERLAQNYLQKIVPSDMRITMPSWKKVDYRELSPIMIDTKNYQKLKKLEGCFSVPKPPDDQMSPKHFIFYLLAKRTDCLLDLKGHKLHFMEPDSLRDLYDKFYLLYNMESLSLEDIQQRAARLKNNRKILLDYLYFKMKPELRLSSSEYDFVDDLLSLPIERRGKRIWEYYYSRLQSADTINRIRIRFENDFYKQEVALGKDDYFCMGEVFRVMFTASRIGVFGKDFVKLILASYSFTMPQYIESIEKLVCIQDETETLMLERNSRMERLNEVFGDSLLGQWDIMSNGGRLALSYNIGNIRQSHDVKSHDVIKSLCILSLLSSNLYSNPKQSITIDLNAQQIIIERLDITALPINLIKMQLSPFEYLIRYGIKEKEFVRFRMGYDDLQSTKQYREIESCLAKSGFTGENSIIYLNMICEFNTCFNDLKVQTQSESVTPSFMLKHIDMTYNILKRLMIEEHYYSADNPTKYKPLNPDNADQHFKRFVERLKELYEEQMHQYYGGKTKTYKNGIPYCDNEFSKSFLLINEVLGAIDTINRSDLCHDITWEWKSEVPKNTPKIESDAPEGTPS